MGEPWMASLCSSGEQTRSLRAPRLSSGLTRNLGATNSEIPRAPGAPPGNRASTRWMMFSARSCSPQEMKILDPNSDSGRRQVSPGCVLWTGPIPPEVRSGSSFRSIHRRPFWARNAAGPVGCMRERRDGAYGEHHTARRLGWRISTPRRRHWKRLLGMPCPPISGLAGIPCRPGLEVELPICRRDAISRADLPVAQSSALPVARLRFQGRPHSRSKAGGLGKVASTRICGSSLLKPEKRANLRQLGQVLDAKVVVSSKGSAGHDCALQVLGQHTQPLNFWILPVALLAIGPNTTNFGTL